MLEVHGDVFAYIPFKIIPVTPQMDVVLGRIAFQESRLDRTLRRLFLGRNIYALSQSGKLGGNGIEIGIQTESGIRGEERKTHVFGKTVQPVKDTQACPSIKSGLVEESAIVEVSESYLLHDFMQEDLRRVTRSGITPAWDNTVS